MTTESGSYYQNFERGFQQLIYDVKAYGNQVECIIVFGSIQNGFPGLDSEGKIVTSDVDFLVIVENHIEGGEYNSRRQIYCQGMKAGEVRKPFSGLIPEAEAYIQCVSAVDEYLRYMIGLCEKAKAHPENRLAGLPLPYTATLQALVGGQILFGKIPDELVNLVSQAKEAMLGCGNRREDVPMRPFV